MEEKKGEGLLVIGAGYGRTGTFSLRLALNKLGVGPTHHMVEVFMHMNQQVPLWLEACDGKPNWDAIFDGYKSAVDFPTCVWWEELMRVYPNALVILTVRDSADAWYQSVKDTIFSPYIQGRSVFERINEFLFPGESQAVHRRFVNKMLLKHFGSFDVFKTPEALKQNYLDHIENVKRVVPKERLLVLNAKEGWKPLCEFLKVSEPEEPFPRVNETAQFQLRMQATRRGAINRVTALLGGVGLLAFVAFKLSKRTH